MGARILWVAGQSERYGGDRSLFTVAAGLRRRGWDVRVTVPGEGPLTDDLRAASVPHFDVDAGVVRRVLSPLGWLRLLLWGIPVAALRIRRLARDVDVVHVNAPVIVGGILGGALSGRPVICHIRESFVGRERLWRAAAVLLRVTCRRVIAVSAAVADEAAAVGLGDRAVLIHNSIELEPFVSIDRRSPAASGPVVMVGRINDWKGQPVLVEALALLRDRGLVVRAEIAGDVFPGGERYERELLDLIGRRGLVDDVTLLGFVADIPGLLRRTGLFVQPSVRPEPFGLALVEAMAAGLACIATDAGGPRDILEHGRTGLLVPPGEARPLADAIELLLGDDELRARMGAAAREEASRRFALDVEVSAIAELYREVTGCA